MSNTKHHNQNNHVGYDFGGRFNCNKHYSNGYGKYGRKLAHKEMRSDVRKIKHKAMLNYE